MPNLLPFIPIIALLVAASALSLNLISALRSRTASNPKLDFIFRFPAAAYPVLPFPHRNKKPGVVFFYFEKLGPDKGFYLPMTVKAGNRKLSDVVVEVSFPIEYAVFNEDVEQMGKTLADTFSKDEFKRDVDRTKALLTKRDVREGNGLVSIRYNVGTLRPGEAAQIVELLRLPPREKSFSDPRYSDTAFSKTLELLSNAPSLRACVPITATVLSDLTLKAGYSVNLVACDASVKAFDEQPHKAYIDAMWLGAAPGGRAYFRPYIPFIEQFRPKLVSEVVVDVINVEPDVQVSDERDGKVSVAVLFDPVHSQHGSGTIYLPGFDPKKLPATIACTEEAIRYIGYVSTVSPNDVSAAMKSLFSRKKSESKVPPN